MGEAARTNPVARVRRACRLLLSSFHGGRHLCPRDGRRDGHADMHSLDEFALAKLAELERRHAAPRAGRHRARRHLAGARRPAAALVLLQRLPQPRPSIPRVKEAAIAGDRALRRGRRRLAAGHRQPSAVRRAGSAAGAPQGHAGRLRVRLRLPRQYRHHSGADRPRTTSSWSTSSRMPACGPARGCAGARCSRSATTTCAMPRRCWRSTARATAHALIATDGVFSMDGDLAPLAELAALAQRYDAWLLPTMRTASAWSAAAAARTSPHARTADVPLQMGTLSKAIGGYGGYLCASHAGHRSDPQPRPHPDLFDRPAARRRSPPRSRRST